MQYISRYKKIAQLDTADSARFLSTALHSVSQAIIRTHTEKIVLYNQNDTACCAEFSASEDMVPDYSTSQNNAIYPISTLH